jgi:hypothetical protein
MIWAVSGSSMFAYCALFEKRASPAAHLGMHGHFLFPTPSSHTGGDQMLLVLTSLYEGGEITRMANSQRSIFVLALIY